MKIKTSLAVAALTILATAGVQAQSLTGELAYVSNKVSTNVLGESVSAKPAALRGILGAEIYPNVAVEGMLGLGMGSSSLKVRNLKIGSVKTNDLLGVFVKPNITVAEGVNVFGRVGMTSIKLSIDGDSSRESSFAYGLGASYSVNPKMSVNADYMVYHDKDDVTIKGFAVGLGYKF